MEERKIEDKGIIANAKEKLKRNITEIATLMILLSIPVINILTGITLTFNLIRSGQQVLDS